MPIKSVRYAQLAGGEAGRAGHAILPQDRALAIHYDDPMAVVIGNDDVAVRELHGNGRPIQPFPAAHGWEAPQQMALPVDLDYSASGSIIRDNERVARGQEG